ncbi:hypothetical protein SAMN04488025_10287 [Planifilum fulgidum]|uniref:Uncharacterized protein n=1 Tax=Planifilum fulgidum TaxID=201973 RepID=A0A1I2KJB6_9BACL|nr:hypothetical protein [Planifilum fulgidum]SFF67075.1 hypothetical protein SAMN04488025_10287 [Planifilum fulgidum]
MVIERWQLLIANASTRFAGFQRVFFTLRDGLRDALILNKNDEKKFLKEGLWIRFSQEPWFRRRRSLKFKIRPGDRSEIFVSGGSVPGGIPLEFLCLLDIILEKAVSRT